MNVRRNSTKTRGCGTKRRHPNGGSAINHMRRLIAAGANAEALNVYRCRHCSAPGKPEVWHVGHLPGAYQRK